MNQALGWICPKCGSVDRARLEEIATEYEQTARVAGTGKLFHERVACAAALRDLMAWADLARGCLEEIEEFASRNAYAMPETTNLLARWPAKEADRA